MGCPHRVRSTTALAGTCKTWTTLICTYAELPASTVQPNDGGYCELYTFVDRFRAPLSQASDATAGAATGRDEFGRPYVYVHRHVFARPNSDRHRMLILNSCIQRMPTIESLGLHELLGTASGASRGSTAPARSLSCLPGS